MSLLVIGKPAEFGSNDFPLRGQCQPHTRGWRLRLISDAGDEEILHSDSYYVCRQIQKQCEGLDEPAIRAKVSELIETMACDMEETQRVGMTSEGLDSDATPVDLPVMKKDSVDVDAPTPTDLPAVHPSEETPPPLALDADSTEMITKDDMEQHLRKRRKSFEE